MAKRKHSADWMLARVREYLSGEGSYQQIARANGISVQSLRGWVRKYEKQGEASFMDRAGNASYSKEFKASCVLAVLRGEGSVDDIVAKYNISSRSVLRHWMKQYNDHIELKDYDPKREVYMAGARKKTSLSERKEIVEYCLSHGKNYKDTAARYDVSYSQVYDWVRKYVADGETGLIDQRGHHKTDEEVDEMERLRRENQRLKRQLEEQERLVYFLKKLKALEGR